MTLKETPAVRHYSGWRYTFDSLRTPRHQWVAMYSDRPRRPRYEAKLVAGTEATLKRKIDEWFDKQGD